MKQVIVIRKDLHMRMGKAIAQGAHASVGVVLQNIDKPATKEWLHEGQTKICVYVNSEKELLELYKKALEAKLPAVIITDAGKTEFKGVATKTCLAIGPDSSDKIDKITSKLPLL